MDGHILLVEPGHHATRLLLRRLPLKLTGGSTDGPPRAQGGGNLRRHLPKHGGGRDVTSKFNIRTCAPDRAAAAHRRPTFWHDGGLRGAALWTMLSCK